MRKSSWILYLGQSKRGVTRGTFFFVADHFMFSLSLTAAGCGLKTALVSANTKKKAQQPTPFSSNMNRILHTSALGLCFLFAFKLLHSKNKSDTCSNLFQVQSLCSTSCRLIDFGAMFSNLLLRHTQACCPIPRVRLGGL
jgi:hypothetical protein